MKKTICLVLALITVILLLPETGFADKSGKCGASLNYKFRVWYDDKGLKRGELTISGSGAMYDYGEKTNKAPWADEYVTEIILKPGITSIGNWAFGSASIREAEVTVPEGVTSIGEYAFSSNYSLSSLTLPSTIMRIQKGTFEDCTGLINVVLPENILYIDESAFDGCRFMKTITLPDGVKEIGRWAFLGCYYLTTINLPDSLKVIGQAAFYNCYSLSPITLPNKLQSIGNAAFGNNGHLTTVTIPASVTEIGLYPFYNCTALTEINVAEGNTCCISRDGVLYSADGSTLINYPAGRTATSFSVPEGTAVIQDEAFYGSQYLEDVYLPDGVTTIAYRAFFNCDALVTLTAPESLTQIGQTPFGYYEYSEAHTDVDKPVVSLYSGSAIDTYLEANYPTIPLSYRSRFALADMILPDDVTEIEEEAFSGIDAYGIWIPDGIKVIGSGAFASCPNLRWVRLPESIESVAADAFAGNNSFFLTGAPEGNAQAYAQNAGIAFYRDE